MCIMLTLPLSSTSPDMLVGAKTSHGLGHLKAMEKLIQLCSLESENNSGKVSCIFC